MSEEETQILEVQDEPRKRRAPVRIGTIVWGLIIAALGVMMIMWYEGMTIDTQSAIIWLLLSAGVLLVGGSILSAVRKNGDESQG